MEEFYLDPTLYHGAPAPEGRDQTEMDCYNLLDGLQIPYDRVDHESAATIALCHRVETRLGAEICKNLFLCNRQKTQFYLLLMQGDKVFKTKYLSKQLGTARLSFADGADLEEYLHLTPGSASVLGLQYDTKLQVQLVIDRPVLETPWFACHPCRNTSTVRLKTSDLLERLLPALGHEPVMVDLPTEDTP